VIAGHVYRGADIPELQGRFVFADHCTGEIMALDPADGTAEVLLTQPGLRAVDIAADDAGELYVVDLGHGVWRIEPA
jgi:streptogramin lyase